MVNDEKYNFDTWEKVVKIDPNQHLIHIFIAESLFRKGGANIDLGLQKLHNAYRILTGDKKTYMAKRLYFFYKKYNRDIQANEFLKQVIFDSGLPLNNKDPHVAIKDIMTFCSSMFIKIGSGRVCREQLDLIVKHIKQAKNLPQTEVDSLVVILHKLFPLLKKDTAALTLFKEIIGNVSQDKQTANFYLLKFLLVDEEDKEELLLLAGQFISPQQSQAKMWLCEFYFNKRKYQEAAKQCEQVVNLASTPWSEIAADYLKVIETFLGAKGQ